MTEAEIEKFEKWVREKRTAYGYDRFNDNIKEEVVGALTTCCGSPTAKGMHLVIQWQKRSR